MSAMTPTARSNRLRFVLVFAVLVFAAVTAALLLRGGAGPSAGGEHIPIAVAPQPWDLTTPEKAVTSYLDWTSFAYRLANSDIASKTLEPTESVRVDSFIELNRQNGEKGIDQHLTEFTVGKRSVVGTRAVVSTKETWQYRYFSLQTQTYVTPLYTTHYDVTYDLVREKAGWLVDKVTAKNLDDVH